MKVTTASCLVIVFVIGMMSAIVAAIGLRQPSLSTGGLLQRIPETQPFVGKLLITNPRNWTLTVTSSLPAVAVIEKNQSYLVEWPQPSAGQHSITFSLIRHHRNQTQTVASADWHVTVTPAPAADVPRNADEQPASTVEHNETATTTPEPASLPASTAPVVTVTGASEQPLSKIEPTVADSPVDAASDTEQHTEAVDTEPTTDRGLPTGTELPVIPQFDNEISIQHDTHARLYGRSEHSGVNFRKGYIRGRLTQVRYMYDVADDAELADQQLAALLAIGAELTETDDPLGVTLPESGQAAVARRGATGIRLPYALWSVLFRTSRLRIGDKIRAVNSGTIRWRLARYEPDPNGFAVVITPDDIVAER